MRIGVGVSTGTEVVCAALVMIDDDGTETVEYRTVSSDRQANTDMGDLVTSAIELMASLIPRTVVAAGHDRPDAIAVTYRTEDHAERIRTALAHTSRDIRLVTESSAALERLVSTGLIDRYDTVALVDLGASGMSVSVVDRADGTVLAHGRSDDFDGNTLNKLVKDLVQDMTRDDMRDDIRDDRGIGSARYRSIKERLSFTDEATIERVRGLPLTVHRASFDAAAAPFFGKAVGYVQSVVEETPRRPEAVVVLGGGAHIPLLATTLSARLNVPVVRLAEPDAVLAVGAATFAASRTGGRYLTVPARRATVNKRVSRYSGAVAAAFLAGGLVLAYGVQTLTPTDDRTVSPAGTETIPGAPGDLVPGADGFDGSSAETDASPAPDSGDAGGQSDARYPTGPVDGPTSAVPETSTPGSQSPSTVPSTTPELRPAPDLSQIPWPDRVPTPSSPDSTTPPEEVPSGDPESTTPPLAPTTPGATPSGPTSTPVEIATPPAESAPAPTFSAPLSADPDRTAASGSPGATQELSPPPTVWSPPVDIDAPQISAVPSDDSLPRSTSEAPITSDSQQSVVPTAP